MTSQPVFMDTLPAVHNIEENGMVPLERGCQCLPASASPASASPASASPASASPADAVGHQDRAGHGTGRDTGQGGTRDRAGHGTGLDTGHPRFRGIRPFFSIFGLALAAFFSMMVLRFWELSFFDLWAITRDFWLFFVPAVICTIYGLLSLVAFLVLLSRRRPGAAARDIQTCTVEKPQ